MSRYRTMNNSPAIGSWTEHGYVVAVTDTHILVEDGNGNDEPRWIAREASPTATMVTTEGGDYGVLPRYGMKHVDGRDVWAYQECYSPDLLWAEWTSGNIEWTPF